MPVKNVLRRYWPRRRCEFNGVTVRTYKWRRGRYRPDFEDAIASVLRARVRPEDAVVVVGGGHGVCSVIAARQGATVTVYEASQTHVEIIADTIRRNDVAGRVDVVHGLVGPAVDVWGSVTGAERVPPAEIPTCDLLVLDCEGAETAILGGLAVRPPTQVVEVHPAMGVVEKQVRTQLARLGYAVVTDTGTAETPVLTAIRRGD